MNTTYASLVSEIHELEQILEDIPEGNVIDRMSLEARIGTIKEKLKQIEIDTKEPEYPSGDSKRKVWFSKSEIEIIIQALINGILTKLNSEQLHTIVVALEDLASDSSLDLPSDDRHTRLINRLKGMMADDDSRNDGKE